MKLNIHDENNFPSVEFTGTPLRIGECATIMLILKIIFTEHYSKVHALNHFLWEGNNDWV